MSCRDTCIVKIGEYLANYSAERKIALDLASLKITDINYSVTSSAGNKDILCFISFNNGQIFQFTFRNENRKNSVFNVYTKFSQTDIFHQALSEADLDIPELPPPN